VKVDIAPYPGFTLEGLFFDSTFWGDCMSQSYRVRYACPQGDFFQWAIIEKLDITLQEVYGTDWDFICPTHGPQHAKPFQAEVKKSFERGESRRQKGR
jgi:hypothetical protein